MLVRGCSVARRSAPTMTTAAGHLLSAVILAICLAAAAVSAAEDAVLIPPSFGGVPRVVWAFWFGPHKMAGARAAAFASLRARVGLPVILVSERNLGALNMSARPMHAAAALGLSSNHLADYVRAYVMYTRGGCYHDIKPRAPGSSWAPAFARFAANRSAWLLGVRESGPEDVGCDESNLLEEPRCGAVRGAEERAAAARGLGRLEKQRGACCRLLAGAYAELVSNGAYCMRPRTPLAAGWLAAVEAHLTAKAAALAAHPAPMPRCCSPPQPPYPLRWAELHGEAFHPQQWRHAAHVQAGLPSWARDIPYRDAGGREDQLYRHAQRKRGAQSETATGGGGSGGGGE